MQLTFRIRWMLFLSPALAACASSGADVAPAPSAATQPAHAPLARATRLEPPVKLQAQGEDIDVGALVGYAGPGTHDFDADGRLDLYVGSFAGKILRHRNLGGMPPAFGAGELLRADGAELAISNW